MQTIPATSTLPDFLFMGPVPDLPRESAEENPAQPEEESEIARVVSHGDTVSHGDRLTPSTPEPEKS